MPTVKNIVFILDPHTAARLSTTSKTLKREGNSRMTAQNAKNAKNKAKTLNNLYENFGNNMKSHFPNNCTGLDNFLKVYFRYPHKVKRKRVKKVKNLLFNHVHKKLKKENNRRKRELENNMSQGSK